MLKNTSNPIVLGIFLGLIGAIAAVILAQVAKFTKAPIEKNQQKIIAGALKNVMPEFDNYPSNDTMIIKSSDNPAINVKFFGGKLKGKLIAVAGQSRSMKGYAGEVQVMVGMDLNGKIRTVLVTKQNETPGLGTVVCDRKNVLTIFDVAGMGKKKEQLKLPPNPILDAFDGHSASPKDSWSQPWKVIKDGGKAKFMTGATITSRAVTDAVYRVAKTYMVNRKAVVAKLSKNNNPEKKK